MRKLSIRLDPAAASKVMLYLCVWKQQAKAGHKPSCFLCPQLLPSRIYSVLTFPFVTASKNRTLRGVNVGNNKLHLEVILVVIGLI